MAHRLATAGPRWYHRVIALAMLVALVNGPSGHAQDGVDDSPASQKYSPDVVAKAEKILDGVGLRQAGKMIQSTGTAEISRAISGLARERRELRLLLQDWKKVDAQVRAIRTEQQRMIVQNAELNMQLARVPDGEVTTNNRIVGMINANLARAKLMETQRTTMKETADQKRGALSKAESEYAETVLAIRAELNKLKQTLDESLVDDAVQIALRVMTKNFETPEGLTGGQILSSLDKRIEKIEQEIFSESIDLDVVNNSLYVDVVVGRKTTRMVIDSGASIVCLPMKTAQELGITVPSDARLMQLVLADGRTIPARGVVLERVRVGEFEAEHVEAAVLDATASDAEPLLGMSFLGNFKFTIDNGEKSLKLLRIKTD